MRYVGRSFYKERGLLRRSIKEKEVATLLTVLSGRWLKVRPEGVIDAQDMSHREGNIVVLLSFSLILLSQAYQAYIVDARPTKGTLV